ncbi:N-acetylmannosamine-6-phosphate 2-epimerase [Enterovibrio nigricans]|uniref:Putative N-acetylmannosamine-6-phosphate 2-epimerase n=1 Tax=Enterovibrio nigricans DSM 22720 TaxID=1121868 RepID=A0A1T4UTG0_9GAMM|nr:N-acetylmannosamine-6-phosphate 2-epimerase [Enterovibrio nigricans]PKF50140.1 putative N-acetylmannosamine-6-phosphate 2-epimerase [Enterovibrio nigricans]SKA55944.1 N-acylglucosamine-6-phosphate 2-epimerase [Enterovibrio nigricans DSM 22720]
MSVSGDKLLATLKTGFVSSCQPVDDGPMDVPEIVAAMAQASIAGGAVALRIEGVENVKATRNKVEVPIIGIIKRDLSDSQIRITPFIEDVVALAEAGADIIAIDATHRDRPVSIKELVDAIHDAGCIAMADCSNFDEGMASYDLGVEIIGTTMSGYVGESVPSVPDFAFVTALKNAGCFVMAEGRYNSPELAKQAIIAGADCVTVGSAITRIEHICTWFAGAVSDAKGLCHEAVA